MALLFASWSPIDIWDILIKMPIYCSMRSLKQIPPCI